MAQGFSYTVQPIHQFSTENIARKCSIILKKTEVLYHTPVVLSRGERWMFLLKLYETPWLFEVHSLAEHAAFSCEGTTSFFIAPGMCLGRNPVNQGGRWMRCCNWCLLAHIRPLTATYCIFFWKDAPSNFQVVNHSQCGDVQICIIFTPIWANRSCLRDLHVCCFPFLLS